MGLIFSKYFIAFIGNYILNRLMTSTSDGRISDPSNDEDESDLVPDYDIDSRSLNGLWDSHCHPDLYSRNMKISAYRFRSDVANNSDINFIEGFVAVFCFPEQWVDDKFNHMEHLSKVDKAKLIIGCHPHCADTWDIVLTARLEQLLRSGMETGKVVGLGEIGLDYGPRNRGENREIQKAVFKAQLRLAMKLGLPVCIHIREAEDDGLEVLREVGLPTDYNIHLHCFTGTWNQAQMWLSAYPKLVIGLTGKVTYKERNNMHMVAKMIPMCRLVLETDSPYFLPQKLWPYVTGFSHPGHISHVAAQIAVIRGVPVQEVVDATNANTKKVYNINNEGTFNSLKATLASTSESSTEDEE